MTHTCHTCKACYCTGGLPQAATACAEGSSQTGTGEPPTQARGRQRLQRRAVQNQSTKLKHPKGVVAILGKSIEVAIGGLEGAD